MATSTDIEAVHAVVDGFHQAAATADEAAYFDAMADDGVFIGTDASERWPKDDFREWARPHFEGESAWVYTSFERNVSVGTGGEVAWFDERLRHERYGETRGSGVLVKVDETWKISQYVLSFPIPNEVASRVVQLVALHAQREQAESDIDVESIEGSDAVRWGSLPKSVIEKRIRAKREDLQDCYQTQFALGGVRAGSSDEVTVVLLIGTDGRVLDTVIRDSSFEGGTIHQCLIDRLSEIRFPRPEGSGIVVVTYPLGFTSKE